MVQPGRPKAVWLYVMSGEVHLQSRSSVKVIDVFLAIHSMDTFSSGVQAILSVVVDYQSFLFGGKTFYW